MVHFIGLIYSNGCNLLPQYAYRYAYGLFCTHFPESFHSFICLITPLFPYLESGMNRTMHELDCEVGAHGKGACKGHNVLKKNPS